MEKQVLTGNPGNEIAIFRRSKLVSPMVLPTSSGKSTGKLCERCYNGSIASPAEEEPVDETCRATILQTDVEDSKKAFPGHLCESVTAGTLA